MRGLVFAGAMFALAACESRSLSSSAPTPAPRDGGAPAIARPAPAPPGPPPVDAAAPRAACASDRAPLAIGDVATPPGWCWSRTEEGDDLSGVLRDDTGAIRLRYFQLAHGARVTDACAASRPGLRWARSDRVRGVAFRYCEIDATPAPITCFSFGGRMNLCTEPSAPRDAFSAFELVRTLQPRR